MPNSTDTTAKFLFFAGSSRKDSLNKKLAKAAFNIAKEQGASATFVDLSDYPMPLYDGDLEETKGVPEAAIQLKKIFAEHDGLLIAAPEYNGSMTPLLVNTLAWLSRAHEEDEPPMSAYKGKVAAIVSASPGGLGGMRGLVPLRMLLGNLSLEVIAKQLAVSSAYDAFDDDGNLANERQHKTLTSVVARLIEVTQKLQA